MPEKLSPVYCKLILSIICYSQGHLVTYETTHDLVKRIGLEESRKKKKGHGNQFVQEQLLTDYLSIPNMS